MTAPVLCDECGHTATNHEGGRSSVSPLCLGDGSHCDCSAFRPQTTEVVREPGTETNSTNLVPLHDTITAELAKHYDWVVSLGKAPRPCETCGVFLGKLPTPDVMAEFNAHVADALIAALGLGESDASE